MTVKRSGVLGQNVGTGNLLPQRETAYTGGNVISYCSRVRVVRIHSHSPFTSPPSHYTHVTPLIYLLLCLCTTLRHVGNVTYLIWIYTTRPTHKLRNRVPGEEPLELTLSPGTS